MSDERDPQTPAPQTPAPQTSGPESPGSGSGRRKLGAVEWIVLLGLLGFAVYGLFFGNGPC